MTDERWAAAGVPLGDLQRWFAETWPRDEQPVHSPTPADVPHSSPVSLPALRGGRPSIPMAELITEMRRMHAAGQLSPNWTHATKKLAGWRAQEHPDKPGSQKGIYEHKELRQEHLRLTGAKK